MFDFYSDSDRKLDLARKLMAEMQAAGLGYDKTHKIFAGEGTFSFSNPADFAEWKRLNDEAEAAKRELPTVKLSKDLPDFDRDTAVNGIE